MPAVQPATGVCRWLPDEVNGNRRLAINGVAYEVAEVPGRGYDLLRDDPATGRVVRYRVDVTWGCGVWSCTCPDATHRRQHMCKHVRALRAALKALPF